MSFIVLTSQDVPSVIEFRYLRIEVLASDIVVIKLRWPFVIASRVDGL